MVVRLRLRIRVSDRIDEEVALLNSGYEAPTPQLLISVKLATKLGLWPPEGAYEVTLETAGGPLKAWLYPRIAQISVVAEGSPEREVTSDIVVSPLADEPMINDKLADELGIAVEAFGRGLWRFHMGAEGEAEGERKILMQDGKQCWRSMAIRHRFYRLSFPLKLPYPKRVIVTQFLPSIYGDLYSR